MMIDTSEWLSVSVFCRIGEQQVEFESETQEFEVQQETVRYISAPAPVPSMPTSMPGTDLASQLRAAVRDEMRKIMEV